MSKQVEVSGVSLYVTPIDELPFPYNFVAAMIGGRIDRKVSEGNVDIEDDMYELLSVCIDGKVQKETVAGLDPHETAELIEAIIDEPSEESPEDNADE